ARMLASVFAGWVSSVRPAEMTDTDLPGIRAAGRARSPGHFSKAALLGRRLPADGPDRDLQSAGGVADRLLQRGGAGVTDVEGVGDVWPNRQRGAARVDRADSRDGAGADRDHGGGTQFDRHGERDWVDESDRADRR